MMTKRKIESESHKRTIVVEFKDRKVDGPLVDQIAGTAQRVNNRFRPGWISDLFIFARGFTAGAEKRRQELNDQSDGRRRVWFQVVSLFKPGKTK
jgi:hypothetical protein